MQTKNTIALSTIAVLLLCSSDANACICIYLSVCEAYSTSSAVFIGRVTRISSLPSKTEHYRNGSSEHRVDGTGSQKPHPTKTEQGGKRTLKTIGPYKEAVYFIVEESFLGEDKQEVEVIRKDISSCDYRFEVGKSYLVYATLDDGELTTSKCNRTCKLSEAAEDLKYLHGLKENQSNGVIYSRILWKGISNRKREEILNKEAEGYKAYFEGIKVIIEGERANYEKALDSNSFEIVLPIGKYRIWLERNGRKVSKKDKVVIVNKNSCTIEDLKARYR